MTNAQRLAPTGSGERVAAIDTLRGFALLGILIMNIQGFAMVSSAYFNPATHMDLSGANWWVWAVSHVFADMKFMTLFSLLFGAGLILATQRRDAAGRPTWGYFCRRNAWLLLFGLIHAYLIWHGDILVTYAVAGFVVFWLRRRSARTLFIVGGIFLAVAPAISLMAGLAPAEAQAEIVAGFTATPEKLAAEIAAMLGSWGDALAVRIPLSLETHLGAIPFYLFWRAGGLMLVGMALLKIGVLTGERSVTFYQSLLGLGLLLGLPLVVWSAWAFSAENWNPLVTQFGPALLLNYIGSLFMAGAYLALIMLWARSAVLGHLQRWLAAVGRMAFTNYILQSVICTFIFYGFGLGLLGQVERWAQVLLVLGIWALQLAVSPLWLSKFRFGPLEWAWRSLTYMKWQPLLKY